MGEILYVNGGIENQEPVRNKDKFLAWFTVSVGGSITNSHIAHHPASA